MSEHSFLLVMVTLVASTCVVLYLLWLHLEHITKIHKEVSNSFSDRINSLIVAHSTSNQLMVDIVKSIQVLEKIQQEKITRLEFDLKKTRTRAVTAENKLAVNKQRRTQTNGQ